MPVVIERNAVVVRAPAYRGYMQKIGGDVEQALEMGPYCDGELVSIDGFMNPYDVEAFCATMEANGLTFKDESGKVQDFIPVVQWNGPAEDCDWLEYYESYRTGNLRRDLRTLYLLARSLLKGRKQGKHSICRLKGNKKTKIIEPKEKQAN